MNPIKITVLSSSNSSTSINKKIATHVARQMPFTKQLEVLDLNDYEMPIYSIDREENSGIPMAAYLFRKKIRNSDLIIISMAEHNGAYTAAFKNLIDWSSRIDTNVFNEIPMVLLSASEGSKGGVSVLNTAIALLPFIGAEIVASMPFPHFSRVYDRKKDSIIDNSIQKQVNKLITEVAQILQSKNQTRITS